MQKPFTFNKRDILLTVKQAASFLNLSVPTIKNYIYVGKLKSIKTPGGHHRIRMSDLAASIGVTLQEVIINNSLLKIIAGLIKAMERKDFSQGHADSVARFSLKVAEELRFSDSQKNYLQLAALLHDIGKIDIDQKILNKPTPLTDDELSTIKKHPRMGEEIARSIPTFERLSPIIRHHHERFDGKGYPDGFSGNKIQIEARIIAVAEAYDFMTTKKPFREALPAKNAFMELEKNASAQFDPEIVEIFLKVQKQPQFLHSNGGLP